MNSSTVTHPNALAIVRRACSQLLRTRRRELFLSTITDRSFEEGSRARDFRESVGSLVRAGLDAPTERRLSGGLNGMLADELRADPGIRGHQHN